MAYRERKTGVKPSSAKLNSSPLLIGINRDGMWVVYDPLGIRGGLFSSRAQALRFATMRHGRPQVALLVPHWIEFDVGRLNQVATDAPRAISPSVPEDRWIGSGGRRAE